MNFDLELFLIALGLAFIIEGLPWALFPDAMRKAMLYMTTSPTWQLRRIGLMGIGAGLLLVWLVRNYT